MPFPLYVLFLLFCASKTHGQNRRTSANEGGGRGGGAVANNDNNNLEFVHICGQFPNRYFSYEPCPPEDQNLNGMGQAGQQGGQSQGVTCSRPGWRTVGLRCRDVNDCYQQRENIAMMCEQGECCAPSGGTGTTAPPYRGGDGTSSRDSDTYLWWQTCENGGYFTGQNCRRTTDCRQDYGQDGQNQLDPELARYEQICLLGECCTTNRELDAENTDFGDGTKVRPSMGYEPRPGTSDQQEGCASFAGGRVLRNAPCQRHGDCNRLVGLVADLPRVSDTQQIACIRRQCCLMQRQLPPGMTDWQQLCPIRQGSFAGMFCGQSNQDCMTGLNRDGRRTASSSSRTPPLVCELNRYCCTSFVDRRRRQNQGCQDGDLVTGTRCTDDHACFRGEYCGEMKICCFPSEAAQQQEGPDYPGPSGPQQPAEDPYRPRTDFDQQRTAAFCYNGEQSYVSCEFQSDCLSTQSCMNGLCCVRSGDEWKSACGGAMAVSSCFRDRTCHDSLQCTSSDYCCECMHGQAAGRCTHGCPPNFACASNGYCCPRCDGGARPHGSCFNSQCGSGYTCVAGNICCPGSARSINRKN